jgi:hypothetical protein
MSSRVDRTVEKDGYGLQLGGGLRKVKAVNHPDLG